MHPVSPGGQAGRQAGPCIFRVANLWYSAGHCHSPPLAVAHTCTCRRPLLCPPLSRDSLTPRSSHAATCFSSVPSGPWGCCRGSLHFRLALCPRPWQRPDGWRDGFLILLPLRSTIRFSPEHICRDSTSTQMLKLYSNLVNCQILKLPFSSCGKGLCEVACSSYA